MNPAKTLGNPWEIFRTAEKWSENMNNNWRITVNMVSIYSMIYLFFWPVLRRKRIKLHTEHFMKSQMQLWWNNKTSFFPIEPPKKRGRKKARAPRGQKRVTRQRRDSSEEPWIPDEIVGCKQGVSGDLEFLFKWKNDIKASFLTFKQARFAYPLEVIEFYERILEFSPQSAWRIIAKMKNVVLFAYFQTLFWIWCFFCVPYYYLLIKNIYWNWNYYKQLASYTYTCLILSLILISAKCLLYRSLVSCVLSFFY